MPDPSQPVPLIPRASLFGNPTRTSGQISPDGEWLSWLAPLEGVLNIWLAPSGDPAAARPMTRSAERPIRQYHWAPDSRSLLYIQDRGGDENFLLYGVDIASGAERTLTPFEKTRVQLISDSHRFKDRLLLGLNNRDERMHDVHLLDLNNGELSLVFRNDAGFIGFECDDNLDLRLAALPNAGGGMDFFAIEGGTVAAEPLVSTGLEDALTTGPADFTHDGSVLYWIDSRGRDTAALVAQDTASGEARVLAENARADIAGLIRDQQTGAVIGYTWDYLRSEWHAFDEDLRHSLQFLDDSLEGDFQILSRTEDDRKWVVASDPVTAPPRAWLFDRDENSLTEFYTSRPELEGAPLQPMHGVEITACDGLTLPAYLTLPAGSTGELPPAPVPMVLLVHGGPWARDRYGFNSYHQWLANRGYAVLSVNYRGSTGFGKRFIEAANLEWAGRMHDDLLDAVAWAVERKIADPDKVAIMGGSYGGYATLVGLTFTPETFACGVDIVGPSNLETLLETIPPYWEPMVKQFHERMGNPNTPEGLQLLKDRSPLHRADRICRPLLIGQGANDPRVKQSESDQIVAAMKSAGIPVTYVLYPDEGHGFARPENNLAFTAVAENFLAACLGGRAEPLGEVLGASTAQLVEGEELVLGLDA